MLVLRNSNNNKADNNKSIVMHVLEQMTSSLSRRQRKTDYTNHYINYRKPDALAEGQGRGRTDRGGGQEKF